MRSSNQSSPLHALGRIRPWVEKARRSVLAQRPTVRWGLAAAAVAVLVLLAYLADLAADDGVELLPRLGPSVLLGRPDQGQSRARPPADRLPDRRSAPGRRGRRPVRGGGGGDRQARAGASCPGRDPRSVGRLERLGILPRPGDPGASAGGEDPRDVDQRARRDRGLVRPDQPSQGAAGPAGRRPGLRRSSGWRPRGTVSSRSGRSSRSRPTSRAGARASSPSRSPWWIGGATSISTPAIRPSARFPTAGPARKS